MTNDFGFICAAAVTDGPVVAKDLRDQLDAALRTQRDADKVERARVKEFNEGKSRRARISAETVGPNGTRAFIGGLTVHARPLRDWISSIARERKAFGSRVTLHTAMNYMTLVATRANGTRSLLTLPALEVESDVAVAA